MPDPINSDDSGGWAYPIDPDDPDFDENDPRIIEVEPDEPRPRWFSRFRRGTGDEEPNTGEPEAAGTTRLKARKIILFLVLASGAVLLALGLFRGCGGGDSHSNNGSDTPTATETQQPTESATTVVTATPTSGAVSTSTPTSVIPTPTITVRADTGDPLSLAGDDSTNIVRILLFLAALAAISVSMAYLNRKGRTR